MGESLLVKHQKVRYDVKKKKPEQHRTNQGGPQVNEKETRRCFHCKKLGQLKKNCFKLNRSQGTQNQANNTNCVEEIDVDHAEALNVTDTPVSDAWILDTGCTFHICPHRDWFYELT